jgi:hypothetical protein
MPDDDEPADVVPAEDPRRPSARSYTWDRCNSCGELISPQRSRCEFCGVRRGKWAPPPRRDVDPHRAGLLSFFATVTAISGVLSCALVVPGFLAAPVGVVTWSLAQRDLNRMRDGQMDRTGLVKTRTARDTALVGVILALATAGGWLAILLLHYLGQM